MIQLIAILGLVGLIWFNWDKIPSPLKTFLGDAKTVSMEVYEKGKDMPEPVKKYVDTKITPKAKEIKDVIFKPDPSK